MACLEVNFRIFHFLTLFSNNYTRIIMNLKENTTLQSGKYRIIRVLGQGGFGITYLAEHTMLENLVAIKEFFPKDYCDRNDENPNVTIGTKNSTDIVQMLQGKFIKEAKNISKLRHPGIITIHDIFQENDTAYYVMDYVDGESLSDMIKRKGPITEEEALGYIRKVADAIDYMHSKSMNHLDIKPANIMIRKSVNEPVLIDFGLAKQYDASGGQTSTTPIGISHGYAPIEQYRPGGVATFTPQTDIYAIGATLYAILTATIPPHYSDILEDGLPALPSSISTSTAFAIEKAMEVKKNKRPQSVSDFLSFLGSLSNISGNRKSETIKKDENCSNSSEDTVLIGRPVLTQPDEDVTINGITFVDLGLSVKWASQNLGATTNSDAGTFYTKDPNKYPSFLYEFNQHGAKIPSISQFKELLEKCSWEWNDSKMGYLVTGPSGKSIFIPVSGENISFPGNLYSMVTFGLLWTNEAYYDYSSQENTLFYFNSQTYKLIFYKTNKQSPIRLVH